MHINMFNHQAHYQQNRNAIDAAISAVLESGQLVMGPDVVAFEEEFANYCGSAFSVAVTSGSSALLLSLRALGIGPGDEVITVANSDMPTSHAISLTGANVVWVDIDPGSYNMNPELLEAAITPKTRAILTVHLYGVPADFNPIAAIAKNYELPIVEDAALATGATYQGKTIGSLGTLTAFSTAPGKILDGVGSGGIVTADNPLLYQRLNSLRHYGRARPPYKPRLRSEVQWPSETLEIGYNERLDSIHAAVLRIRLRQLDEQLSRRRTIAKKYQDLFANTPVRTQQPPTGAEPSWRFFTVRIPGRDRVYAELFQKGIETMLAYLPVNHLDACYRHLGYKPGSLPETEKFATELLALPCHPYLSDADVEEVASTLLGLL